MASETPAIGSLPRTDVPANVRLGLGQLAGHLALVAFGATVVLSPFRVALVLISRPRPPLYGSYTDLAVALSQLALLATLALWAISLAGRPRQVHLGPWFLRWPVAGLLAISWLGAPFSLDPTVSAFGTLKLSLYVAFALYALNEIGSIRRLAWPVAAMVGIQSFVALGQLVAQQSLGLQWLGELPLDPKQNGVSVVAAAGTTPLLRAYGLTDHPNILGGLLALGLLVLLFGRRWDRDRGSILAGLVVAIGGAALFATFSRAAWLALGLGLLTGVAMLAISRRRRIAGLRQGVVATFRRRWLLVGLGLSAALALLVVPFGAYLAIRFGLGGAASVTEQMSLGERSILASDAVTIAAGHLLIGTGLGTFPIALMQANPTLTFDYQPAHVVLLDAAAELGLLGAACYLAIVVGPWLAAVRRRAGWSPDLVAASAALAALTLIEFFDHYPWSSPAGGIWVWLILGLWAGAYAPSWTRPPHAG